MGDASLVTRDMQQESSKQDDQSGHRQHPDQHPCVIPIAIGLLATAPNGRGSGLPLSPSLRPNSAIDCGYSGPMSAHDQPPRVQGVCTHSLLAWR
jgi:hypothetical protein